jgi:hypothetical protein
MKHPMGTVPRGQPAQRVNRWRAFTATLGVAAVATLGSGVLLALSDSPASATSGSTATGNGGDKQHKVTICHRTDSETNPYVQITVDVHSVDGDTTNDHGRGDHLAEHTGDVWYPGHPKEPKWGDIIPPFYADGTPDGLPSLNWNDQGMAIFNNGCNPVTETTPTSPPTSPSSPPTSPSSPPTSPSSPPTTATPPPTTKPTSPSTSLPPPTSTTQSPPPTHHTKHPAPPPNNPSPPHHFPETGIISAQSDPYQSGSQLPLMLIFASGLFALATLVAGRRTYVLARRDDAS